MKFDIKWLKNRFGLTSTETLQNLIISNQEIERLSQLPRYLSTTTVFLNRTFRIVDACTFLSSLKEIFNQEIYKFNIPENEKINIIDCGANIGLATIYLKEKFRDSYIISFEPDKNIFSALEDNILSFGYKNIDLRNAAVSFEQGEVEFHNEGGHSGMISKNDKLNNTIVKTERLKDVINKLDFVTFLKIDIEGHETEVLIDIAEELYKVKFMFLEYHSFIDNKQTLGDILNIITKAGFRYYIKESFEKQFPFLSQEMFLKMDLISNIFCYRI